MITLNYTRFFGAYLEVNGEICIDFLILEMFGLMSGICPKLHSLNIIWPKKLGKLLYHLITIHHTIKERYKATKTKNIGRIS